MVAGGTCLSLLFLFFFFKFNTKYFEITYFFFNAKNVCFVNGTDIKI